MNVIVSIRVKFERLDDFLSLVFEHRRLSRQEPGCLSFSVLQDLDDPLRFVLNETFTSRKALCAHQQTEHYQRWRAMIGSIEAERRTHWEVDESPKVARAEVLAGIGGVFTNGCFDGLHPGHIHTLEWARRQGNCLVVGVNDDESVRRLKGPDRPRVPLSERMKMLAALTCIDFVTSFSEDTPENLIRALRPVCVVKGSDYTGKPVISCGAPVLIAPPCAFTLHTSDLLG